MEKEERISGALQENILTCLVFDDKHCKTLRGALTPQLFESSVSREVAGHAIDYIDQFGEAVKEHLPDLLEDVLSGDNKRKADLYKRLLENLYQARDSVNADYVISELHKFVRLQTFKSGVYEAVEALQDGRLEAAEVAMHKALTKQVISFEAGLSLGNADDINALLDDSGEEEGFELGIPELDENGNYPRRKELTVFIAARGKGKSWFITHGAKQALLQRWKPLIVSLEMEDKVYGRRFLQSFFSISKRQAKVKITRFGRSKDGELNDFITEELERVTMRDEDLREKLGSRIKREFGKRVGFRIKSFPTAQLTLDGLTAYLDGLERYEKFTPDVMFIDYPMLMKLDANNLRLELGKLIEGLRGIAVERKMAVVIVAQGNRESEDAQTVTGKMLAEDISALATADLVFTYSQTAAEYALGLARIMVEKARNESAKFSVLITQAYAIGQFCLDSMRLGGDYWESMMKSDDDKGKRRRKAGDESD